jgi:high affinity Mn2+ porin
VRRSSDIRPVVLAGAALVARILLAASPARAQAAPPGPHDDAAFDFMNVLSRVGQHDIDDESWNAYGQSTYISSWKLAFHAPPGTTNVNGTPFSLLPTAERSFTWSFTLFFGTRLWQGGEAYLVPEVIAERPLSGLHGLGGAIQNFELQKTGSETPQLYRSRTYLRQTFGLGGASTDRTSQPSQLATKVDSRRIVVTAGNFSIIDVFDKSSVNWDPRRTFLNMAFMTHASWDFPSDARGYSYGGTVEWYWDDWAWRVGRITPPQQPNQLATDFRIWQYYGDELELEHDHTLLGQAGAVRLLGYRNRVFTGSFDEAIAAFEADPSKNAANCSASPALGGFNYGSTNASAPDLCWVRRPNVKVGLGISLEQYVTDGIGVFGRAMYSDGRSEVDAFNSADRSVSIGAVAKGTAWHRSFDVAGVGFGASWISKSHVQYLAMGGVDGFIGDGYLTHPAAESVAEVFYSLNLFKALWLTPDYQLILNPAYNADRGPVHVLGARAHAEF